MRTSGCEVALPKNSSDERLLCESLVTGSSLRSRVHVNERSSYRALLAKARATFFYARLEQRTGHCEMYARAREVASEFFL
jgi:hypothetical protein